jgi:hypothetical protein
MGNTKRERWEKVRFQKTHVVKIKMNPCILLVTWGLEKKKILRTLSIHFIGKALAYACNNIYLCDVNLL